MKIQKTIVGGKCSIQIQVPVPQPFQVTTIRQMLEFLFDHQSQALTAQYSPLK